jgi:succinate dehydrogenase / fumarate reductase, iron-sulfur subunit
VSPVKVFWHHKLPDQKQIKRIYHEVEERGERIELNLYIVGESGDSEEGAMSEDTVETS